MKTGVLTFHRVYNYGAVLQAYSTQKILDDIGIENEIIDFSMPKQRDFTSLYSTKNGIKRFFKTLLLVPYHHYRKSRIDKFDRFILKMKLSPRMYYDSRDLVETNSRYSCFLVGSDQIWNVTKKAEFSDGYFLDFVDGEKDKISYASSIGNASYEELLSKKKYLERFKYISCREKGGASILSSIIGKNIPAVLDPTLLVDKSHLLTIASENNEKSYILYYSLDGYDSRENNIDILSKMANKFGLKIKFVTPEWPKHKFGEDIINAGPEDFLGLIKNASLVCTNSFHGTALAIKLNTAFYVLEKRNIQDERKRSILIQLGLENRIISSVNEVDMIEDYNIDFNEVNISLEKLRKDSLNYLKKAFQ